MDEKLQLNLNRMLIHPFYSVMVPVLFFWIFIDTLIGGMARFYGLEIFPPMFVIILLLSALSELIVGNLLKRERIEGLVPRLREIVFVLAGAGLLILLFHGDLFGGSIDLKNVRFWLPLFIILVQWIFSLQIHRQMDKREIFLGFFSGKKEEECRQVYTEFNHESGEALSGLRLVRRFLVFFIFFGLATLIVVSWLLKVPYTPLTLIIATAFFLLCLFLVSHINTMSSAQFIMMDGLVTNRKQRSGRLWFTLIVLLVLVTAAVPLVADEAPLPTQYLVDFFEWLQSLQKERDEPDRQIEAPEFGRQTPRNDMPNTMENLQGLLGDVPERSGKIAKIIGYTLLGALGIAFFLFLFVPLFRKRERLGGGPGDIFWNAVARMRTALKSVRESLLNAMSERKRRRQVEAWNRSARRNDRPSAARTRSTATGRQSVRARRTQGRFLKAFFRYTKWGTKRGVAFRTSLGAMEYSRMVAARVPENEAAVLAIAELFEEVMYSNHVIPDEKRGEFFNLIKQMTRR